MDALWNAVSELAVNLHPDRIEQIARGFDSLGGVEGASSVINQASGPYVVELQAKLSDCWKNHPDVTPQEIAAGLRSAARTFDRSRLVYGEQSLVWTGPDTHLVPVRRSEQVLLEIINSAKETLFLVSFVLVNIPEIEEAIRTALAKDVDVRMLLESEDKNDSEPFQKTIDRLLREIPGLTLYVWPREKRESVDSGFARVHAKCIVADQSNAFLTSANLTSAALDRNIEMGVNIRNGDVPKTIYQQFMALIRSEEIVPYAARQRIERDETSVTPLFLLVDDFSAGAELTISFDNENLNIQEVRTFKALAQNEDKPKLNSVVLIRHFNHWLVGKYTWSKQQDTEGDRVFYLVAIRGFGPKQQFEVEECDWDIFMPRAVEFNA